MAPPAYRPGPTPKVLQTKSAHNPNTRVDRTDHQSIAVPTDRSQKIVQPKIARALPALSAPKAPPIYRPQPLPKVLQQKEIRVRAAPAQRSLTPRPHQHGSVLQRQLISKESKHRFMIKPQDTKITLYDEDDKVDRGFADFHVQDKKFWLKTISTKSKSEVGPKGSGAMLVYSLARIALNRGFKRIMVSNATPEETGFYLQMGFQPDPDFLAELVKTGMTTEQIDRIKNTTLSADVNALLDQAGGSVVKNWQDSDWDEKGLYAGKHAKYGDMFHVPL
ncbi:MAG TPA: hypothetical protein DC054_05730 [Blastocatellia bacterium]|nr:hypothetical protein [Blastocatellia bacterium]